MTDLFEFERKVPQFAVMGNPISHSKSPRIHSHFAEQTGVRLEYTAVQVDVGGFEQAVEAFRANGGRGLNITVPFKTEAFDYADELSPQAQCAGAVNTLSFDDDGLVRGNNTDGSGLVFDITRNLDIAFRDKRVLILGGGGATRGVTKPVADEMPSEIVIANRTADKAVAIAHDLTPHVDVKLTGCGLETVAGQAFDLVINATAASLDGKVPDVDGSVVADAELAYDMMYGAEPTSFMLWAQSLGCSHSVDGLGMLVEQAADAFDIWHGVRPDTGALMAQLRSGA